MNINKN